MTWRAVFLTGLVALGSQDDQVQTLITRFQNAPAGEAKAAAALEISQNYQAKMALKNTVGLEATGREYYQAMKGNSGILAEVRALARERLVLAHWSPEVVDRFNAVENVQSALEQKAPMDLDEGLLASSSEEARALRGRLVNGDLRGNAAIARFTADADREYQAALREVGRKYGVVVDPRAMGLTITTPWHAEAYLASEVLKQGGVAEVSLLGQTVAVTEYKIDELAHAYEAAPGPSLVEAARGTLKDLKKVNSAFIELQLASGVKAELAAGNQTLIDALESIVARPETAERVAADLGGATKFFERCKGLIGSMETAFVAQGPVVLQKVRLYQQLLSGAERQAAVLAVANGEPLPAVAARIDHQLARISAARLVSVRPEEPGAFLRRLESAWTDLSFAPTNENVVAIMSRLDDLPESELVALVGPADGRVVVTARKALTPAGRMKLYQRLLQANTLEVVEKNTFIFVQKADHAPGGADRGMLYGAALIGLAQGIAQTGEITDRRLSPDAERRAIIEAWSRNLPVVGDIFNGLSRGGEFVVTGDAASLGESALSLAMGASWLVPQLQIPVLVVMAGSATVKGGWNAYVVYRHRDIIQTWVISGHWDMANGKLLALRDGRGDARAVPPDPQALAALFDDGGVPYHTTTGTFSTTGTIRESLIDYVNGTGGAGFVKNPQVEATVTALKNLLPDFDPFAAIALPGIEGRRSLEKAISAKGPDGERAALGVYVMFERLYRAAIEQAMVTLKADAEAEFQAEHMVGEARTILDRLTAMGERLRLPLVARVDAIQSAVMNSSVELLKTPWEKHSIAVRLMEDRRRYADGYAGVEDNIAQVRRAFTAAGLTAPQTFNLTGFLNIDAPRMKDLAGAYISALAQAGRDAEAAANLAKVPYVASSTCADEARHTLLALKATQVLARDLMLLSREWSGRASAANQSRDAEMERARRYVEKETPLPVEVWRAVAAAVEDAYGWATAPQAWAGSDFSQQEATARERLARAEAEYEATRLKAQRDFAAGCQTPDQQKPHTNAESGDKGPVPTDPVALCDCYNEWFVTKYAPDMQKWCEVSVPRGSEDKCITLTYTVTSPFVWVPKDRVCRGSWTVNQTLRSWRDIDERKRGEIYSAKETSHTNGIFLSEAASSCKEIRLTKTGVVIATAPCGGPLR